MLDLVVVIPAYNEVDCIKDVLAQWCDVLGQLGLTENQTRVLVVDDGSTDGTRQAVEDLAKLEGRIQIISKPGGGHGSAVLTGYRVALDMGARRIFQVDSDNEFDPGDFGKLWRQRDNAPFVFGCRVERATDLNRRIISRGLRALLRVLFQVRIPDANVPYRLMKREYLAFAVEHIPPATAIPNICVSTLAHALQVPAIYLPVTHRKRSTGQVSILRWRLVKICAASCYELMRWRLSFRPLRYNFAMHGMWLSGPAKVDAPHLAEFGAAN
ncbi:glycosyltransferase family 2 protein [Amycolatopsis pithecellobii]|uniref:Glycosyltransferase n=1 Tax=Amycolatopsis pithecellobii TaxID=664692 RepID=A0A6N7Z3V4_9PSEU|nr:glycosyltransferase family 2 protein [Amycolatopsis pithecellobii]MTD56693.1 glycosyltransferase [Amycolatopsis pithecellobii]